MPETKFAEPVLLFVKPQAICDEDKAALSAVGVIVIETADPSDIKLIRPHAEIPSSDLLRFACKAINEHSTTSEEPKSLFGRAVAAALAARS